MTDFLQAMASASRQRLAEAQRRLPSSELRDRLHHALPVRPLPDGFLLIAEVKRNSPASGTLAGPNASVDKQVRAYTAGGSSVISILTEPSRFGGCLNDLADAARVTKLPVMRKDFLVDPCQVVEARAHNASGVLLIVKMLDQPTLMDMVAAAEELGMFVLIEAFDREDLERCQVLLAEHRPKVNTNTLFGLNTRDLRSLSVCPKRLQELADHFPPGYRRIAESGLETADDLRSAMMLGYDGVLIGTALMRSSDPEHFCRELAAAAKEIHRRAAP